MITDVNPPAAPRNDCAFLLLTQSCNLRCTHCYVDAGPAVGKHMSLATVELAFDLLGELGIDDVRLTGGEPSIHPDFERILEVARHKGIRLGLASNGVKLLNTSRGREIIDGLSRCWISLYGASAASHSTTSGRPARTFHDTVAQVGVVAAQGTWIGLSVLASPGDIKNIDTLMKTVLEAGVSRLRILPIQPDGRARGAPIDWAAWPEEVREIAIRMQNHPLAARFDALTINDPFDLADRFGQGHESCLLRSRQMWSITPDGSVYPCCFTAYSAPLRLGSVGDPGMVARLVTRAASRAASACHGLKRSFWRGVEVETVTCPIGSFDPRHLTRSTHAS